MSSLTVLLVEEDTSAVEFVRSALGPWGDELQICRTATAAMKVEQTVDVALVDLGIQKGAGLALVHFLRARDPNLPIVALTPVGDPETVSIALSLGVNTAVPKPLTGDSLLVALSSVRERKASAAVAVLGRNTVPFAPLLEADNGHSLATVLAHAAAEIVAGSACVVLEDPLGGEIVATAGPEKLIPGSGEALVLGAYDESIGALHVTPGSTALRDPAIRRDLDQLIHTASAIAVLLRRIDAVARIGIKDPETSAYTFAYFVDAAGREIERARRYNRRFGLLTFLVENYTDLRTGISPKALRDARRELVDTILDAVRDSDVLAHVEDDELYLLLPETGMLGALTCRRRISERHGRRAELARLEGRPATALTIGVATFPRDGREMASLLKAAHNRGNAARGGVTAELRRRLPGGLEALLGALLRFRPEETAWQIRQAALSGEVLATVAAAVVREAVSDVESNGVMYIVGEKSHPLVRGAWEAVRLSPGNKTPAYWLRPRTLIERGDTGSQGARLSPVEIEVDGPRVGPFVMLAVLSEGWTYACVASDRGQYARVMHTCDLEIVEALVAELQTTFHLQKGFE